LKSIVGVLVGILAARLIRREGVRGQIEEWFTLAPSPLREAAESAISVAATTVDQIAVVLEGSRLPPAVKTRAHAAAAAVRANAVAAGPSSGHSESTQPAPEHLGAPSLEIQSAIPDEVLAEQDAAARAVEEARRQQQAGL